MVGLDEAISACEKCVARDTQRERHKGQHVHVAELDHKEVAAVRSALIDAKLKSGAGQY